MTTNNKKKRYQLYEQVKHYCEEKLQQKVDLRVQVKEVTAGEIGKLRKYKSAQLLPRLTDSVDAFLLLSEEIQKYDYNSFQGPHPVLLKEICNRYGVSSHDLESVQLRNTGILKNELDVKIIEDYKETAREFCEDLDKLLQNVITPERMKKFVDNIFGHAWYSPNHVGIDYRIKLAKILLESSAEFITTHLPPDWKEHLEEHFKKAVGIAQTLSLQAYEKSGDEIG